MRSDFSLNTTTADVHFPRIEYVDARMVWMHFYFTTYTMYRARLFSNDVALKSCYAEKQVTS